MKRRNKSAGAHGKPPNKRMWGSVAEETVALTLLERIARRYRSDPMALTSEEMRIIKRAIAVLKERHARHQDNFNR